MKKIYQSLACLLFAGTCAAQSMVSLPSLKVDNASETDNEGTVVIKLQEDFSLMTAGEEGNPAPEAIEDDNLSVPPSKTHMPGWQGYYLHEAGGMLYIGLDDSEIESGALNTPRLNLTEGSGAFTLRFRAKSGVGADDKIYVYSKPSLNEHEDREVKVTAQWQDYELKFENGAEQSYIMFTPWLDAVYIDDIVVEVMIPYVAAPKNLTFCNYTVNGFTAAWAPVEEATGYILNVYTKDASGNRAYAIEEMPLDASTTSYEVTDLPASDSFYFFSVKATDGTHTSPESVEIAVEGLLLPVIEAETELSERGFTANWKAVDHATSYNFIATREHTAAEAGPYDILKQDFEEITGEEDSSYDYTSIPQLPGWTIASPTFLPGEIGVVSANGQYGSDAWIQSSVYDFSHNDGKVNLKMNVYGNHKKYTSDILVGLFTYDETIDRYRMMDRRTIEAVGKDGALIDLELQGGGKQSIIQIEPDGYAKMMIRDIQVSQNLNAGDKLEATVASRSTSSTSITLSNLDILPGDRVYYVVRAVGRNSGDTGNIYSDYTDPRYVELPTSGITDILNDEPESDLFTVYNLQGMLLMRNVSATYVSSLPAGLYIINGRKRIIR